MNGEMVSNRGGRYERETGKERISRELARKLGGLANKLVAGAKEAVMGVREVAQNLVNNSVNSRANRKESGERLIKDCGFYDREKYSLQGREGVREIEDSSYINEEDGVFGIFDGAGGVGEPGSGGRASRIAKESFSNSVKEGGVRSPADLANYLTLASREIGKRTEGITTATVAKIVKREDGHKYLYYASVGDSRLYVVHKDDETHESWAKQVTRDEGERNLIANWLGREDEPVKYDKHGRASVSIRENVTQVGWIRLHEGDKIVLCSDGITGDVNRRMEDGRNELMWEGELASIVNRAGHVQMAARALVEQARKKDDRSAIVVEV